VSIKIAAIALMMEAARTSETLVNFYQTTRCYNPEDSNLHTKVEFTVFASHPFSKKKGVSWSGWFLDAAELTSSS
jgi:hypothetical protein